MKKLIYLSFAFLLSFFIASCEGDNVTYDGESFLHFSAASSAKVFVKKGSGGENLIVKYGTISGVKGTHNVKLVVDAQNSTAKEGVDFTILNNNVSEIKDGEVVGEFVIKALESGATLAGKKVVFKLQSSTLKNAVFSSAFTLEIALSCPYNQSFFNGNYKVAVDTWEDYVVGDIVPVQPGSAANQIKILASKNAYIANAATAYMILTVNADGTVVVTSNEAFDYGGANKFAITGSGKVDFCSGDIDLTVLNYGNYKNYKLQLKKQ